MDNVLRKIREVEQEVLAMKEERRLYSPEGEHRLSHTIEDATTAQSWLQSLKLEPGQWKGQPLVVLSLFDGIGGVWAALSHLGIPYTGYSAEINPYAVQLLKARYPHIHHLGDITELNKVEIKEKVDLIVGGFPCQDLSAMGKKIGLHGSRSRLFFEMLRIIDVTAPRWFLVENVASMWWGDRDEISACLKCIPIEIDSQELTPGKRRRLYWTNLRFPSEMPNLKNHRSTYLQSILENATALEHKAGCILASNFQAGGRAQLRAVIDNETKTLRYINTTELERLMGYPVGYTNIRFKTPSAWSNGKKKGKKGATIMESDRIRWNLLGNSFSVPIIAYLLHPLVEECNCLQSPSIILPEYVKEEDSTVMREGEVWALYNSHKRPNWYAEIVSRRGGRFSQDVDAKLEITVRFLELTRLYLRGENDQWSPKRGTGLYDSHGNIEKQESWVAFSHRVTSFIKTENGYFLYPGKDEIWAVYCPAAKNHYFVYILESHFNKPVPDSGFKPDKENFHSFCRALQETEVPNTYRFTDLSFDCTNLSIFAFRTPYLHKNADGYFRLETNGIRGIVCEERNKSTRKRKRTDDNQTSDEEDEAAEKTEDGEEHIDTCVAKETVHP